MTVGDVVFFSDEALRGVVSIAFPLLLTSLAVGLLVVVFQALTQIQDGTLQFVPKILAMFAVLLITLPLMAGQINGLANRVFERMILVGQN